MLNKVRYYIIYQITNLLNNHIYIGAHQTYNIYDKYMGSSKYLKKDLKELGRKNFRKDILFVFNNKEDMMAKEAELVNKEFCYRVDTYNKMIGGISEMSWNNMIITKDKDGNLHSIYNDDPRYLSGELFGIAKNNNYYKNKVSVKDNDGNTFSISVDDTRYLSGELKHITKNTISIKDKDGNCFRVDKDDSRYLSGELVGIWKNKTHSDDSKLKIKQSKKGTGLGDKNSQFGTCWITRYSEITKDNENKKIKKEELDQYINNGWTNGRR